MKITINRLKLIDAIKEKQAELDAEKKKAAAQLVKDREKFLKDYLADVQEHLTDVKANRFDPEQGPQWRVGRHYWPQPYHSSQKDYNHLIKQLELSEDDLLSIDDKSDYFAFLQ
jgi:hypothetical protein